MGGSALFANRFGPRAGGVLLGLPLTAGPVAVIVAVQEGPGFAAQVAGGFLAGIVAEVVFALVFVRLCQTSPRDWRLPLCVATMAFAATGATLVAAQMPVAVLSVCALGAIALALSLMPDAGVAPRRAQNLRIGERVLLATALVIALTSVAPVLGPTASGVLSSFPLLTCLLAVYSHHQEGSESAVAVCRGFLTGLFSFASFAIALCVFLAHMASQAAFAIAATATLGLQAVLLFLNRPTAAQLVGHR